MAKVVVEPEKTYSPFTLVVAAGCLQLGPKKRDPGGSWLSMKASLVMMAWRICDRLPCARMKVEDTPVYRSLHLR